MVLQYHAGEYVAAFFLVKPVFFKTGFLYFHRCDAVLRQGGSGRRLFFKTLHFAMKGFLFWGNLE